MEIGKTEVLSDVEIDFSYEEVMKSPPFSKWRRSKKVENKIDESFETLKKKVIDSLESKAIYKILKKEDTDVVDFSPPEPILKSDFISFCVVTVGEGFGESVGSSFSKFIIDAMENAALNRVSRVLSGKIREMASREGLNTTRVLSPGSGRIDWGIENQKFIFKYLDAEMIGVELVNGSVLRPTNSVSYIVGIGSEINQADDMFTCEGCERGDCAYRS